MPAGKGDLCGVRLGPYVVETSLGEGATGCVYKAVHAELGRSVALKVLHPHIARRPHALSRFSREGRAAARMRHPHVVAVHDQCNGDRPYLVMDLVEGRTLADRLRAERLGVGSAVDLLLPIVAAVAHAHEVGVIHRDLKPSNVLLERRPDGVEVPRVTDFGVSKIIDGDERDLTRDDGLVGTIAYMAPEQMRSARDIDDAVDQYALAAILYESIAGRPPYDAESSGALMQMVLRGDTPIALRGLVPSVPSELESIVMRALNHEPEHRFACVRTLGAKLLPFASADARARWSRELRSDEVDTSTQPASPAHRPIILALAVGAAISISAFAVSRHTASLRAAATPARATTVASEAPFIASSGAVSAEPRLRSVPPSAAPSVAAPRASAKPAATAKPHLPVAPTASAIASAAAVKMGTNDAPILE